MSNQASALCSTNSQLFHQPPKHEMTSEQPDHENDSLSGIMGGPPAPTPLPIPSDKPSGPTVGTRLIIFSALVIPSALIPLLVLRRSVNNLHRKVDELKGATRDLHHEFKSVILELSVRREQHGQLQTVIAKTRDDLTQLRGETYRRRKARARGDERMQGQVQELVAYNQYVISLQLRASRDLTYTVAPYNVGPRSRVSGSWGHLSPTSPHSCKRCSSIRDCSRPDLMVKVLNAFGFLLCNLKVWVRLRPLMPG